MAQIDQPIKRLFQRRPTDWVRFIVPGIGDPKIRPFKTEYTPKVTSKLDDVFWIESDRSAPFLIHLEPMGYLDETLPIRMLRYRSDLWEATYHEQKKIIPILQIVLYFYPAHDHGTHFLQEAWHGETFLKYTYKVIRVWELNPQEIVENGWLGLFPLIPLMRGGKPQTIHKEALQYGLEAIMKVADVALQRDLLAVMGVLAGEIYPKEWIHAMIRREMIMESPIYQDWLREEREKAMREGMKEGMKEGLKEGIKEGMKEGMKEGVKQIARNMLEKGFDEETIMDVTGLTKEEIRRLKNQ